MKAHGVLRTENLLSEHKVSAFMVVFHRRDKELQGGRRERERERSNTYGTVSFTRHYTRQFYLT